jgi:hypothetical protein
MPCAVISCALCVVDVGRRGDANELIAAAVDLRILARAGAAAR